MTTTQPADLFGYVPPAALNAGRVIDWEGRLDRALGLYAAARAAHIEAHSELTWMANAHNAERSARRRRELATQFAAQGLVVARTRRRLQRAERLYDALDERAPA